MRFEETLGITHFVKLLELQLRQRIDSCLSPLGISGPQYSVLSILENSEGLTNAELARRSCVTPQTMVKLMRNLDASGFVQKVADDSHGLKINFSLTPKAKKVICDAHVLVNQLELKMVKGLKKKDIAFLLDALSRCRQNLLT